MSKAKEYLSKHVRNIDSQLAQMRQEAAAHSQKAAQLTATAAELQSERDAAAEALESIQPRRKKANG